MEGALFLVGLAFAALLVVAIGVAWWEQTAEEARIAAKPPPRALAVDLHLDHLADLPPAAAPPAGDQPARDAVMGQALARMTQPAPSSIAWMETQPMVAPGKRTKPVPSSWG